MNRLELVKDTIAHKRRDALPYQLDLTDAVRTRLVEETGDPRFEENVGNCLLQERNESFDDLGPKYKRDMFGVIWSKDQDGDFGVIEDYILTDTSLEQYSFPVPQEQLIREKCERLCANGQEQLKLYIIGFSLFERAWTLRGMENVLVDFLTDVKLATRLLDQIVEYNLAVMDIAMEYDIDGIFFGDDWGQQQGLIMGPELWRKFLKPCLKKMYRRAKDKGLYVFQHSCGDIAAVFPDLIDLGLDVYNTFQPEIYNVQKMKQEYGRHITFYGGISTQQLLPVGSPNQVREETKRLMDILGADGGYIVAPTHAVPADVPSQNIFAFLDVVQNQ